MFYVMGKWRERSNVYIIKKLVLVIFLGVKLDFTRIERRVGVWVLNAAILKDNSYKEKIKQIVESGKMHKMYKVECRGAM